MPGTQAHPVTRFIAKVKVPQSVSECWQWQGAGKGNGYGSFNLSGEALPAHRAAYLLFCGKIEGGLDVCHSCDNRACVNPDHLFLGTRQENMADCSAKGRARGYRRRHLKESQVQEVKRLLGAGHRVVKVAQITGISHVIISNIKQGKSYGRSE